MKRAELDFRDGRPAVNVKIYTSHDGLQSMLDRLAAPGSGTEWEGSGMDARWIQTHTTQAERNRAWETALEDGWGDLQDGAYTVFGPKYATVYAAGRSGGWAVIREFTREHTESWDAIALGRWAQWARYCREACDDQPARYAGIIYQYHFEPMRDRERARARFVAAASAALCTNVV